MEDKDFSGIVDLLCTNGVGFIKCYFRSCLHPEDLIDSSSDNTEWRIDFSDGVTYLGSLHLTTGEFGDHDTDLKNERILTECTLYLGKWGQLKSDVQVYLSFYSGLVLQGECVIVSPSVIQEWK